MVAEEPAGPPSVMIQTSSKSCSEPITDRKIQIRMVGPSSGSTTLVVVCQAEAPSRAAASRNSVGTPWSPARNRMMPKPRYFQVETTNRV